MIPSIAAAASSSLALGSPAPFNLIERLMKKLIKIILSACLLISAPAIPASAQSNRIGTIDFKKVWDGYWKKQRAEAALKDRQEEYKKDEKSYIDSYNNLNDEFKKLRDSANDQSVTAVEREKRKNSAESKWLEVQSAQKAIQEYDQTAAQKLEDQMKRMHDNIVSEVRAVITAKAKAASYTLVIDTSAETAPGVPAILYSNNENDMTQAVLKDLNLAAPAASDPPKATDKKDDKK
jgi:Skp family chaperone for outer membrane proteins